MPSGAEIVGGPGPLTADVLAPYVPSLVVDDLRHHEANVPRPRRQPMAVLFADISGFTALTERLAQAGPDGVERLSSLLNDTFDDLVEAIARAGGDTLKFAGDALLAVWPTDEGGLADATRRAAACGLSVRDLVHDRPAYGGRLSIKVAVSAGEVSVGHCGGFQGRRELVIAGAPLDDMAAAEHLAERGQVVLGATAMMAAGEHFRGQPLARGCLRLDEVTEALVALPVMSRAVPDVVRPRLRSYVPEAVLARLDAGQSAWLAELRRVSVLFLNIRGLDYDDDGALATLDQAMRAVQTAVGRLGGAVNKLLVDDKGTTLLAAFGLPPHSHEDDPRRALRAADDIRKALRGLGLGSAIGVTTARVFAGPVGGARRREYTILGDGVNTAARLMQAAGRIMDEGGETAGDEALCDEATFVAAGAKVALEEAPELALKGKAALTRNWRLSADGEGRGEITGEHLAEKRPTLRMIGRPRERRALEAALERAEAAGRVVVVIEGEAGIGKSTLLADARRRAEQGGLRVHGGSADALDVGTPFHAYRALFGDMAKAAGGGEVLLARASLAEHYAPLLNPVLGTDVAENDVTRALVGRSRFEVTADLLGQILERVSTAPRLLILEDAHWFDTPSWQLTERLAERLDGTALLLSTRPTPTRPRALEQLLAAGAVHLHLDGLARADSDDLVCRRFGVEDLPEPVGAFVFERAQGNPFFTEELALGLRDAGAVVVEGGRVRVSPGHASLEAVGLPTTVEGVVTQRIDRLAPGEQLALKTASVIGRRFWPRAVAALYPVAAERGEVASFIERTATVGLTMKDTEVAEREVTLDAHLFRHAITRDVTYQMMLLSQRAQLHAEAGRWYEETFADDLSPHCSVLAHHYEAAGLAEKAVRFLDAAGRYALLHDANAEALQFFRRARALDEQASETPPHVAVARARRLRMMGEAEMGRGRLKDAPELLKQALGHLGLSSATPSRGQIRTVLAKSVGRHLWLRVWPLRTAEGDERERTLEVSRVGFRMAQCYYYANYMLSAITAGITSVNHALPAGFTRELAQSCAAMSIAAGLVPVHPVARHFARWARRVSADLGDVGAEAYVGLSTSLYTLGTADFASSDAALDRSLAIYQDLGERKDRLKAENARAMSSFYQGRYLEAERRFVVVEESAHRVGDRQQEAWGVVGQGLVSFRRGHTAKSLEQLSRALIVLEGTHDRSAELLCRGLLAACNLLHGDDDPAEREADRALHLILELDNPTSWASIEGYTCTTFVLQARVRDGRSVLAAAASNALTAMARCARVFPLAKPASLLMHGVAAAARGHTRRALRLMQKGVARSDHLALPWEAAFGLLQLARTATSGADRRRFLDDAERRFTAIEADGMVAAVHAIRAGARS